MPQKYFSCAFDRTLNAPPPSSDSSDLSSISSVDSLSIPEPSNLPSEDFGDAYESDSSSSEPEDEPQPGVACVEVPDIAMPVLIKTQRLHFLLDRSDSIWAVAVPAQALSCDEQTRTRTEPLRRTQTEPLRKEKFACEPPPAQESLPCTPDCQYRFSISLYVIKRLGLESKDLGSCPLPDPGRVFLHNLGESYGTGPEADSLKLDWFCKGATRWTMNCALILAKDYVAEASGEELRRLENLSYLEIIKLFVDFLVYSKRCYSRLPGIPEADEGL